MNWLVTQGLLAVHLIAGAAWFGAVVYRTFFVDPKMRAFCNGDEEYEQFSLHLARNMRYVVMASLLACGLSGFALLIPKWSSKETWQALMAAKFAVWVMAGAGFVYISWVYWPRRAFTLESGYSTMRRRGIVLSVLMISLAGAGMVLGQVAMALK